jgi:hypothetical protein
MKKRFWLWLLLPLLFSPGTATAQSSEDTLSLLSKQSHRDLPGGFDLSNPQEMMAQRLQELHELHQLQDQVQTLLNDRDFRKQIGKFSPEDLQRLQEKMRKGEGLSQDDTWKQLLQQVRSRQKLDPRQIDILKSWAERVESKPSSSKSAGTRIDDITEAAPTPASRPPADSDSPPPSPPPPTEPPPSMLDRLQEDSTKWLMENLKDVSGDVLEAFIEMGAKEGNTPLAELLRSVPQSDFSGINISGHPLVPALRAETFSRYLSKAEDFVQRQSGVWNKVGSFFQRSPLPSLSRMGGGPSVSMRTPSAAESDGWLPAMLSLLMLGVIVLLLCKRGFDSKGQAGSGTDAEWRLGSWPVPPGAVSTRQDVIRAFEYLALLRFGPAAAACHHRQLAERLAEQDGGNPSRRQVAEMLAWLYEQARYAPDGEALSHEQLSDARHALCSLAGVTAA